MICPSCKLEITKLTDEIVKDNEGSTVDCPHCHCLLIIESGKLLDFHGYMNEQDPNWPKDGHGTFSIEISENGRV